MLLFKGKPYKSAAFKEGNFIELDDARAMMNKLASSECDEWPVETPKKVSILVRIKNKLKQLGR